MIKKKGQAAIEFITTYGWVVLVILAMIGVLAYVGLLSPGRYLPDRCTATSGFVCRDFDVRNDSFNIILINVLEDTIKNISLIEVESSDYLGSGPTSCMPDGSTSTIVNANQEFTITCSGTSADMFGAIRGKVNIDLKVEYFVNKQVYPRKIEVSIYSKVQS